MHLNHHIFIGLLGLIECGTFTMAMAASVHLKISDETAGNPLPCRIYLKDEAGQPVRAPQLPYWKDHFVCPGEVNLDLAPGSYTYEIDRGPEYYLTRGRLTVAPEKPVSLTCSLQRMVDLAAEGWWCGDLHVHRPVAEMDLLMEAEDLHVAPVITWWNNANPWRARPAPEDLLVRREGSRFYHVMAGEDERGGGALLYFNLDQPLSIAGSQREYPSAMTFLEQARRGSGNPNQVWVDIEKPFWWDTPIWAASGLVDSVGLAHNHMQRAGMLENEAWGKARDRQRYPAPLGNGHWTQQIYYHLLNAGLRLPPTAGSASGVLNNPVGYNRAYVYLGPKLTYETWWKGLRNGRVFVSNGPLLRCQANGAWPGQVFQAEAGQAVTLKLEARIDSRDRISKVELVRNGVVERSMALGKKRSSPSLGELTFEESGWFLVRVMADVPNTFRFASTGPFYVEIGASKRRISGGSAQFFLDWVRQRRQQLQLEDASQRTAVLHYIAEAERFWQRRVEQANAE